jgi:DNA-binding CsgD family transcriptional regulator
MPARIVFNEKDREEICSLYEEGKSSYKIAKVKGCDHHTILKLLKTNNIHIKTKDEVNRKNAIDHSYFDTIDREDKAYFLGFLFADGNVTSNSNRVTLKLNIRDMSILETFSNFLYSKNCAREAPKNFCYLEINSGNIRSKLIDYGCTPNKSLTLQFPQNIPEDMIHHFMRGYFDGDGCISVSEIKNKNSSSLEGSVAVISTKEFCQVYGECINKYCGFFPSYTQQKESIARGNLITTYLKVGGNKKIINFYHFLYRDASIFLKRKKEKFKILKEQSKQRNISQRPIDFTEDQINNIIKLYGSGITAKQIGKDHQCSSSSILRILKKSLNPINLSI